MRTAEAYNFALVLTDELSEFCTKYEFTNHRFGELAPIARDIAVQGLELCFPEHGDFAKNVQILMDHRPIIKSIICEILRDQPNASIGLAASVFDKVATMNEEIRRIEGSKRYRYLSLTTDFLIANKGLLFTLLGATFFGIKGNLLGCGGVTLVGGLNRVIKESKVAEKALEKFRFKGPVKKLKHLLGLSIEPFIERLLSVYLGAGLKTIQTWRIRKKLTER
jgi:hypothetical protein